MLPDFNEPNIGSMKYVDFSGIIGCRSSLSDSKVIGIVKPWVSMPESPINLDCDVVVRQKEVHTCVESSCTNISNPELMNIIDSNGCQFVGDYIFDFGDSVDFSTGNVFRGDFGQFSDGIFTVPIGSIFSSGFPDFFSNFATLGIINDGCKLIGSCDNSGGDSARHGFVFTGGSAAGQRWTSPPPPPKPPANGKDGEPP